MRPTILLWLSPLFGLTRILVGRPGLAIALTLLIPLFLSPGTALGEGTQSVTGVEVSSTPESGDTYVLGETIRVTLTFSETVNVTGTPRLKIDMDPADWGEKWAAYASGSGTASLTFAHEVVEPNLSTQGIAVLANSLEFNGGAIKSAASQADATLSHVGLSHDAEHKVDWRLLPSDVVDVHVSSRPAEGDTYKLNEMIYVTIVFDEPVTVNGAPRLMIDMDPADWGSKWAEYAQGSGTEHIHFAHTVVEPNMSTQGIAVLMNSLELNGGAIQTVSDSSAARLSHVGLAHDPGHKVDWQQEGDEPEPDVVEVPPDDPTPTPTPEAAAQEQEECVESGTTKCTENGTLYYTLDRRESCTDELTLSVRADIPRGVTVDWGIDQSPEQCYGGGVIYRLREKGNVNWDEYEITSERIAAILRSSGFKGGFPTEYLAGNLKVGHEYEAQVVLIDTRNDFTPDPYFWHYSPDRTALVVLDPENDPQKANAPSRLRVAPDNNYGLFLSWTSPANTGGKTLNGYEIELTTGSDVLSRDDDTSDTQHHWEIIRSDPEAVWTARVAAKYSDGTKVWSPRSEPLKLFYETIMSWFIDETPNANRRIGRIFMMVNANRAAASAVCAINRGEINCPPNTLVSLDLYPGGRYSVTGESKVRTEGDLTAYATDRVTYIEVPEDGTGTNYTEVPTVTVSGADCVGVTAVAHLKGSKVGSVEVTNNGHSCTGAPTVTFSGGGTGASGAAATAHVHESERHERLREGNWQLTGDYSRLNVLIRVWASGGSDSIYVGWTKTIEGPKPIEHCYDDDNPGPAQTQCRVFGSSYQTLTTRTQTPNGYVVEYRKQKADGAWPSTWMHEERNDTSLTSLTLTGLAAGRYQVRASVMTDYGVPDGDFNWWGNSGPPVEVTVAGANAGSPAPPRVIETWSGSQSISVRWAIWDGTGSKPYGYTVRYKEYTEDGSGEWQQWMPDNGYLNDELTYAVDGLILPMDELVMICPGSSFGCTHARQATIGDLTTGTQYMVEVTAHGVNGSSSTVPRVWEAR